MAMTLGQLAEKIGARLEGSADRMVHGCAPVKTAGPGEVAFVANLKYARFLETTRAAAVIVDEQMPSPGADVAKLICTDPYFAFRNAQVALHGFRAPPPPMDAPPGTEALVSASASVHPAARIGAGSQIHPHAVVERDATIGTNCVLYPGSYVGESTIVGDDCVLFPGAVVYERCVLGHRVTLHGNCVVGHDGFGYATHGGRHHKIPQAGRVVLEDDVELGAGCAIERAALGETRIGAGTKLADLVSIGHGTTIGKHCLLVSLVGISGSVEVGNYVVLGGQVGVTGHLTIGDGVQAAGRSAIVSDIEPGRKVGGVPAIDLEMFKRNAIAGAELYDLLRRVRKLEKDLEHLRNE